MKLAILLLGSLALAASSKVPIPFERKFGEKIVGGIDSGRFEFPYMVGIRSNGKHFCGGVIVNQDWIITTAHCAQGPVDSYRIVAGDHDNSNDDGSEQLRDVTEIHAHEEYDAFWISNDIALMKVFPNFVFNENVQPAILPPTGSTPIASTGEVIGWGRLNSGGTLPNILQKVTVPFVTDADCRDAYGEDLIFDSMLCAGEGGKDACQGDSGGPLLSIVGGNRQVFGLTSWGIGCAQPGYPGVYTETAQFSDWISTTIANN